MDVTEGFEDFVSIVEAGSVAEAARRLGVPRATLSRRLSRLEASLGTRLLLRTTRRLDLTQAGEALFVRARRVVAEASAAREAVARLDGVPRGLLRVSLPPGFAPPLLAELLTTYVDRYPEVQVELSSTTRHVDLAAEGYDVALRGGPAKEESLVSRLVLRDRLCCVASPGYLAERGTPCRADELRDHDCVLGFAGAERAEHTWPLLSGGSVRVTGRVALDDLFMRVELARWGRGIALTPEHLVSEDLAEGRLVEVLKGIVGADAGLRVVYPERRFLDPKVRTFVDHVVSWVDLHALALPANRQPTE